MGRAGWRSVGDAKKLPSLSCQTVGWMVNDDPVVIVGTVSEEGDTNDASVIPLGCVTKVEEISFE